MNHQMFEGITAGLTSTYSVLAQASQGKITLSSIAAAQAIPIRSANQPDFCIIYPNTICKI